MVDLNAKVGMNNIKYNYNMKWYEQRQIIGVVGDW